MYLIIYYLCCLDIFFNHFFMGIIGQTKIRNAKICIHQIEKKNRNTSVVRLQL